MQIRTAVPADAASLIKLWTAAGLKFRPEDVPAELGAVLARDPELVLVTEDPHGLTAAVLGTFDGRRGWVNRLANGRAAGVHGLVQGRGLGGLDWDAGGRRLPADHPA